MANNAAVEQVLSEQLLKVATVMEEQIDEQINKMEKMDEDDYEALKRKRLEALKKGQEKRAEWKVNGHGQYEEIPEEKNFFGVCQKSERCVVQFYRPETERCKIFDKHLKILAQKHMETKFAKINAEKCPFLTQRLNVRVIPTLVVVRDAKVKDYIVGFTDLGNKDEFSTEMLEWRLGCADAINYSGDLQNPPDGSGSVAKSKINIKKGVKKTIKGNKEDSSDDDDW